MIRPLRDVAVIELDDVMHSCPIQIQTVTDKWRESRDQLSHCGKVLAVGPGKPHPKTGMLMRSPITVGRIVLFSELQYQTVDIAGKKCALVTTGNILGVQK